MDGENWVWIWVARAISFLIPFCCVDILIVTRFVGIVFSFRIVCIVSLIQSKTRRHLLGSSIISVGVYIAYNNTLNK